MVKPLESGDASGSAFISIEPYSHTNHVNRGSNAKMLQMRFRKADRTRLVSNPSMCKQEKLEKFPNSVQIGPEPFNSRIYNWLQIRFARNGRKPHPKLYESLGCIAKGVVEEASQDIPSLCWPLSWWVVGSCGNLLTNALMATGSVLLPAVFP